MSNQSEAQRFLAAIDPSGDFVFQTFDDDKDRKDIKRAIVTREISRLAPMNAKGAGIFFSINQIVGKGGKGVRLAKNVVRVRALFADFDRVGLPDEWPIDPSIIVESSPKKFHVYWIVDGDFPLDEFEWAQRSISDRFGSDGVINDLPRVMRLPGYLHQKGAPFEVSVREMTGQVYSYAELLGAFGWEKPKPDSREKYNPKWAASNVNEPYVRAAVERALNNIGNAVEGTRNHTLNSEAFGIFGLVKAGHIPGTIRSELIAAARAAGLVDGEIFATLDSAWGAAEARKVPERRLPEPEPEYEPDGSVVIERDEIPETQVPERPAEKPENSLVEAFQCLGYNKEFYYYLPKGKGQVVSLKASDHTKLRMFELADLAVWQGVNGGKPLTGANWDEWANALMRRSEQSGIFDETRIRGRGAWVDGKRIIVHTGTEVHIGKEVIPLHDVKSSFIYEAQSAWEFGFGKPATSVESHRLVEICERLTWADKLSGALMAGWCVLAPVSGALTWRPHIWITGPSGSGKTTAIDVIKRVVGPSAERVDGKTSEAGIRQKMGYDARPVIMDEVESEDQASVSRVQGVLDLARVSSSGGEIIKGTSSHRAVKFNIRSCFCLSSINTAIRYRADESRISKLTLIPNTAPDTEQHYQSLLSDLNAWFDENYASRMFTRTVTNLPVLIKNCATFTTAAAIEFRSRRAADQIGPMLAGYYLCHRTDEVSLDRAREFIREHSWDDYLALNSDTDDIRLFQFIISRMIDVNSTQGKATVTIGTAIEEARTESGKGPYTMALGARGIKVDADMIGISDNAENTRALFKDKPEWSSDWKGPLRNVPGAMKSREPERFAGGIKSRLTWIPYGHLTGTYVAREPGEDVDD